MVCCIEPRAHCGETTPQERCWLARRHGGFFVREAAIVDVEIRVEQCAALGADEGGLGFDPQAGFLLRRVGEQARLQIGDDVGVGVGDIVLFADVGGEIVEFDAAGPQGRQRISNLQFSPTLNVALPEQSFLTFYPPTDIRYELLKQSWFVPFDVLVGRLWGRSVVTSLEASVPIYYGAAPLHKYKIEARIGFFF